MMLPGMPQFPEGYTEAIEQNMKVQERNSLLTSIAMNLLMTRDTARAVAESGESNSTIVKHCFDLAEAFLAERTKRLHHEVEVPELKMPPMDGAIDIPVKVVQAEPGENLNDVLKRVMKMSAEAHAPAGPETPTTTPPCGHGCDWDVTRKVWVCPLNCSVSHRRAEMPAPLCPGSELLMDEPLDGSGAHSCSVCKQHVKGYAILGTSAYMARPHPKP